VVEERLTRGDGKEEGPQKKQREPGLGEEGPQKKQRKTELGAEPSGTSLKRKRSGADNSTGKGGVPASPDEW